MKIGIIGTGMSGLSCARHLHEGGVACELFDKGRRPGGRMASRVNDDRSSFDHGAQYFTARSDAFLRVVEEGVRAGAVAEWTARFGEYDGATLAPKASPQPTRYVGTPTMNNWPRVLAQGLNFAQSFHVQTIDRDDDGWWLTNRDGTRRGPYDWLVVTAPAEQAADLLSGTRLEATLRSVQFAPSHAVLASWDAPLDVVYDGLFVNSGPLSWVARNTSKPGRPDRESWVLHSQGSWSLENWDQDGEWLTETLVAAFAGLPFSPDPPSEASLHRWKYAIPQPLEERYLVDLREKVICAGDYCGGPKVEGAFLSGLAAADQILTAQ